MTGAPPIEIKPGGRFNGIVNVTTVNSDHSDPDKTWIDLEVDPPEHDLYPAIISLSPPEARAVATALMLHADEAER